MKKTMILAAAMFTLSVASAQNKDVIKLEKALEKNDAAIADAKKASTAAPWIDRANIYIDMANVYTKNLIQGFGLTQVQSVIGAPMSTTAVEFKGVPYNENKFENFDIYTGVEDNMIAFWVVNNYPVENPTQQALDALIKAKELSSKDFTGSAKGSVVAGRLQAICQADGMSLYSMDKPAEAAELFNQSFEIGQLTGTFDTVYLYYAGIGYYEAGDYDNAISAIDKVLEAGNDQDGMAYYYLADSYSQNGNHEKAIELLEEGFAKYPSDNTIMGTLINTYMAAKKDPMQIIEVVHKAQALDPKNASLFMVESSIYNEMGESEKAYEVLEKVMNEVDPTFFQAFYNYGIMKILEAQALNEEAGKLDLNDVKGYNAIMDKIIATQADAIEVLEKGHELNKENAAIIDLLKQLYFPRRDEEGAKERYEYFNGLSAE